MALVSDHVSGGSSLVLTFTPNSGQTAVLHAAQVSARAPLLSIGGEITITGLDGGTLYEKIEVPTVNGGRVLFGIPSEGIPASGIDTDIVLTVPALTGVGLAGWMVCDNA